ncbi:MAG: AAA domain-containing protein [Candidatus Thermoplasmatota archaeon]
MAGCRECGRGERSLVRFGAAVVEVCSDCHALRVSPIVDARVPSFDEHLKALQEEIRVEEEEGDKGKELRGLVEDAHRERGRARVRLQLTGGKDRWVVKGSRLEGFPADAKLDSKDAVNVEVLRKAGTVLDLEADPNWGDLPKGYQVLLRPTTSATLYRNLLKAFLVVKRRFRTAGDLMSPQDLPRLSDKPIAGWKDGALRPAQAKAVRLALNLPDRGVFLVQGPPGTGKTTVIARFLKEAIERRKTVLVTSHTHVAIDNALRKALRGDKSLEAKMVRLGESGKVAADLAHVNRRIGDFRAPAPDEDEAEPAQPVEPLFTALQKRHPIVGMTLDALANALVVSDALNEEVEPFDYVLVDEAGMNAFPKVAIAHAVSKRLVLVGDPLQLPPIVRAWSFRNDENYKRSHFELLQMLRPDLSVLLDEQFRCHPAIYAWSKDAVYAGKVTSAVGPRPVPWKLLGEPLRSPVVWVDTSKTPGNRAEQAGSSRINDTHLDVSFALLKELVKQGLHPGDLGYITPFRAQAERFRERVADDRKLAGFVNTTAATVDAFQGNERKAIVFDLTTLHPAKPHEDHRRLNVSLTRAEDLLMIVGPRRFVTKPSENPFLWSLQNWQAAQVIAYAPATT